MVGSSIFVAVFSIGCVVVSATLLVQLGCWGLDVVATISHICSSAHGYSDVVVSQAFGNRP